MFFLQKQGFQKEGDDENKKTQRILKAVYLVEWKRSLLTKQALQTVVLI